MRMSRIVAPLLAAIGSAVPAVVGPSRSSGMYSLPKNDFVWNWGEVSPERRRGHPDIEISGGEGSFAAISTAQIRPSSSMTPTEYQRVRDGAQPRGSISSTR